jgi:hypothetical protein
MLLVAKKISACCALAAVAFMPFSASASTNSVQAVVQQQWVPATHAEQESARGGAWKDLSPKAKKAIITYVIVKKIICKKKGTSC